jgi:hypothetical protein
MHRHASRSRQAPARSTSTAAARTGAHLVPAAVALPPPPEGDVFYTNYPLDRAETLRTDEGQLQALLTAASTRLLPLNGSRVLVQQAGQAAVGAGAAAPKPAAAAQKQPAWVQPAADVLGALDMTIAPMFLGLDAQGTAHFAGGWQGARHAGWRQQACQTRGLRAAGGGATDRSFAF